MSTTWKNSDLNGTGLVGGSRPLVAVDGVFVLVGSADVQLLGRVLSAVAHVELVVNVGQAVKDQSILKLDQIQRESKLKPVGGHPCSGRIPLGLTVNTI